MSTARTSQLVIADPVGRTNPSLVVAATRAGATGLLDAPNVAAAMTALGDRPPSIQGAVWLRLPASCAVAELPAGVDAVVLAAGPDLGAATTAMSRWTSNGSQVIAQVVSLDEATAALAAGATGLLASGSEAGGRVGDTEAFILLQQTIDPSDPSKAVYAYFQGTSMASPAVAAVAALVKQKNPGITAAQLQSALIKSADDEGKPGTDQFYGKGFVNARKAVQ